MEGRQLQLDRERARVPGAPLDPPMPVDLNIGISIRRNVDGYLCRLLIPYLEKRFQHKINFTIGRTQQRIHRPGGGEGGDLRNMNESCSRLQWPSFYDLFLQDRGGGLDPLDPLLEPLFDRHNLDFPQDKSI